jgi:putative MATE family efflux protein
MNAPLASETQNKENAFVPVFATGSILKHLLVMTATGSIGLMAIFLVDFLSLFYISRLGDASLTAGVGYATVILFFATSINIGMMIGVSALTARAIGARQRVNAVGLGSSGMALMVGASVLISLVLLLLSPYALTWIGAHGKGYDVALRFLNITVPSNVLMALGMGFSGLLRAAGDAKRAMWVTLMGGLVTAALDPLFIFGMNLGVDGAAFAVIISRLTFALIGFYGAYTVHRLVTWPRLARLKTDIKSITTIAAPAILTNVATPVANVFIAASFASFGDQAVAAGAVIDRVVLVAFGGLFALSGSVGPILSQNFGARQFDRMRQTLSECMRITALYVGIMWLVLILCRHAISDGFQAQGLTDELIVFFCWISGAAWLFLGALFVANATFNNLGYALNATLFNWGRATLGTVPFVTLGAWLMGPKGIFLGVIVGAMVFGIAALFMAFRVISQAEAKTQSVYPSG